jgi:ubiquitin-small subunit ribosomal protein S27Ae
MPKKKPKNKTPSKRWEEYKKGKPKFCSRCGPPIIMAEHKDRFYCGSCHLVIMKEKVK